MRKYFLLSLLAFLFLVSECFGQKDTMTSFSIAGLSLENPNGLGGNLGVIGIGLAVQHKTRSSNRPDGNAGIYAGLGDPVNYIGIGTSLSIYGLSRTHGTGNNVGESGLNIDISRVLFNVIALKVGVCNLAYWGPTKEVISAQRSYYGTGTFFLGFGNKKFGKPLSYISVTAGAGNGLFRKDKDFTPTSSGSFNPFLSVATPIFAKTNVIAEWTGYDISTGISSNMISYKKVSLYIDFMVTDYLTRNLRFALSTTVCFNPYKNNYHDYKKM